MMYHYIWLSSIFGPLLAINGLWMLLYHDNLQKVLNSVKNTAGILYLVAIINLLIGLTILSYCNLWKWHPALLITLLGWFMVVRAVLLLFIPQLVIRTTMTSSSFVKVMGVIPLIWGLLLSWFALFP